ncbi:MAG: universal stress protein [Alphaproteobacteria bacterium]|nr:universal stress protein [Alphaproteobacteria bacterium]
MAIRDILVHLGDDPRNDVRTNVALGLAAKHEARLIGLYVLPIPTWPATAEGYVPVDLIEKMMKEARAEADKAKKWFLDACRKQGVKSEWRLAEGDPLILVPEQARYADLVVVGQVEEDMDVDRPSGVIGLPEETALTAGRPVLIVPYAGKFRTVGKRVLVAWNGSREATRAVHDALPLLTRAQKTIVFSVNADTESHIPGADISAHLARHGVKAEAQHTVAKDIEVGDALLGAASDLSIDLIVMGCYGHSRLREFVLGGATRELLRHMTVPVLLAH